MKTTIAKLSPSGNRTNPTTPILISAVLAFVSVARASEPGAGQVVWDNGDFDTVPFSGSLASTHASGDDFRLARDTVLGGVTIWVHDLASADSGGSLGELDSLDSFTGTLSVAFYRNEGGWPGQLITTRELEGTELVDTGAIAPTSEHIFRLHGRLSMPLTLPAGQYWIIFRNGEWLSAPDGPSDMVIRGTQSHTMFEAVYADDPTDPMDWSDETNTADLAFQLHATEGFLGHDVSVYGRFYDSNGVQDPRSPFHFGTVPVDPHVEFEPFVLPDGSAGSGGFDFDAFTIDIDESNLAEIGFRNASGNFNGYVIEDTNRTLPDFVSATIDESVSTRTSDRILVSPNTIWVNSESLVYEPGALIRINVTFADSASPPAPSLSISPNGDMIVEAPAEVGNRYRFEESSDLRSFTPIDRVYRAESPFVTTFVGKDRVPRMSYRLRAID